MSTPRTGSPDRDDKTVLGLDRLITMANQIGDFFAPYPPERRAEGIRNHLRTYWDPRMRATERVYPRGGVAEPPRGVAGGGGWGTGRLPRARGNRPLP